MTKNEFLQDDDVKGFVDWLANKLSTADAAHSYVNRRTNELWSCSSVFDAFKQYAWPTKAGSDFNCNAAELDCLKGKLSQALEVMDDNAVCEAAVEVMYWGGVGAGNVRWLRANRQGLAEMLKGVRDDLSAGDCQNGWLANDNLRFNAGMTKVYSLICENFVIYDSRVAAALGWLVAKYCQSNSVNNVPELLEFPWAPAKEAVGQGRPKLRNPSVGNLIFPRLQSGLKHAQWNLRASWLLKTVVDNATCEFRNCQDPLRALEAALFMIGYDLSSVPENAARSDVRGDLDIEVDESPATNWTECYTLAKRSPFEYCITDDGIKVRDGLVFEDRDLNAVLEELWGRFKGEGFPLSNSATKVRSGDCEDGLGRVYFEKLNKNPPDTSKLAAILEDLNVFIPVGAMGQLAWKLADEFAEIGKRGERFNIRVRLERERAEN